MINIATTRRKGCHSAVCCCFHHSVAWEGPGDLLHLQGPQWGLAGSPWILQQPEHRCSITSRELFFQHRQARNLPGLRMNFFVLVEKSDWKSSVCLQDLLPLPCNPYVKPDCAAVGSRVPWDNLQLITLSEGGSGWQRTVSLSTRSPSEGTWILHAEPDHPGGLSMHLAPVRTGGKNAT